MTKTLSNFVVEKEKLIFNSGEVVAFPYPIKKTLEFDNVVVVMLEIQPKNGYSNNVFAVNQEGKILWQIEKHPKNLDISVWLDLNRKGDYAQVGNWDGLELIVEPTTGKILQEWVGR